MLLAIPHSAEFRWGRVPWLALGLMALCTAIYYAQDRNNQRLEDAFLPYCEGIHVPAGKGSDTEWSLTGSVTDCSDLLSMLHMQPDKERFIGWLLDEAGQEKDADESAALADAIRELYRHYERARLGVPASLDAALMADPLFFNPLRAITSALAHASWAHLIGNLIFFFAFTPALEMVIASRLRLAMAMVVIALATDFAYFAAVQLFHLDALPSLGFSGVVMGMIGLCGFLLPKVKIRTFVWVFFYARNIYLPAALLAAWYIGWDAWYMVSDDGSSSVNFIAHVFGGVTGYLLGYYWFRDLKKETRLDVADEIEHHRAERHDRLGILSSYRSSRPHLVTASREQRAKREFSTFLAQVHRAVNVGNDALAINLLLSRYDDYRHAIELYEEIYREMLQWHPTRAVLCLSRLLISEYIDTRKYAKAIEVARRALQITPEFVFAEPGQRELLEAMARRQGIAITEPAG